jgi:polysaccharide biosynthesis/export protein
MIMRRTIAALLLVLSCTACASSSNLPSLSITSEEAAYRLGSGDELKITVYGEERLTVTFPVNGQGSVAFPLVGDVPAGGKTLTEFQQTLSAALAQGFINNPSVSVEVANFRPYYILGEVNKPGEYSYADELTVFGAVARAGGFTYRANQKRIFIRHKSSNGEEVYRLEGNTPVQPGDTIRVGERAF